MPNDEKPTRPSFHDLALRLDARLRTLAAGSPGHPPRPAGWATHSEHYQNYAYLAALLAMLKEGLQVQAAAPGEYRREWPDGDVMLLAQMITGTIDLGGPGEIQKNREVAERLLASVMLALKASPGTSDSSPAS